WCVASYCFIVAAQMLLSRAQAGGDARLVPRGPGYSVAGALIGALSALVGIGGGSMTVPLLVWRGVTPVRAVGTSSACGIFIGIGSALGYALQAPTGAVALPGAFGYVYLPAALGVALASVFAAPYGTRLAHALSGLALKRVFAVFLLLVGGAFAYSALT
ncbi:MAG TPA: sulfite exporter TauE/SafE family protein, partial [Thermomonas sp.]|nr:sulfite exporter TauE/SafE family protein [Thermomonas sp.]